jgi:type III pantothenate kinase
MSPMRQDLLTLDCGNSTIDCLDHRSGRRQRIEHGWCGFSAADPTAMRGALGAWLSATRPMRCVLVAVVPQVRAACIELLQQHGVAWRVAGEELPCPLPLDYATPATLGADRWVGALAAHAEFGRAVVVDCGSATTVNLVEADGVFRGGPIAPGVAALLAGMAVVTPRLPVPDLAAGLRWPPDSSQAAVDSGVKAGYCGMVQRLVADMLRIARGPSQVVLTGGRADLLAADGRLRAHWRPQLIHDGLRLLERSWPCDS